MFKRIKRAICLVAAVAIFLAGVAIGKGTSIPVTEAASLWQQSVEDVVDLQAAVQYLRQILPELKEADNEELRQMVVTFLEKILEGE